MIRWNGRSGRIILPSNIKSRPELHELHIAVILSEHLKTDIEFVPRANVPTADFLIDGVIWELKSPTGTGKNNIQRQLQEASRQSKNIIIDASRSKMHNDRMKRQVEHQFRRIKSIHRLLLISKAREVFEIPK